MLVAGERNQFRNPYRQPSANHGVAVKERLHHIEHFANGQTLGGTSAYMVVEAGNEAMVKQRCKGGHGPITCDQVHRSIRQPWDHGEHVSGKQPYQLMDVVELAYYTGAGVSNDRTEPEYACPQMVHGLRDQLFRFVFALLVSVSIPPLLTNRAFQ